MTSSDDASKIAADETVLAPSNGASEVVTGVRDAYHACFISLRIVCPHLQYAAGYVAG